MSWVALETADRADVLDALGFEVVGEASDAVTAPHACAQSPNGWLIVTTTSGGFVLDKALAAVSAKGFAVGCDMSEQVMVSEARGYANGREAWAVIHDPEADRPVATQGEPPPQLAEITRRLEAQAAADQRDVVDYMFDVPIDLAASICGYRPDQGPLGEWTVLRKRGATSREAVEDRPSFSPGIKSELLPLLRSLGWELTTTRPDLFPNPGPYDVFRYSADLQHHMWFDYGWSGREGREAPYLNLSFAVWDERAPSGEERIISGALKAPDVETPLWKRLLGLFGAGERKGEIRVEDVVEEARQHVIAADAFLKGGDRHPDVQVRSGRAKDTWPDLP